MITKKAEIKNDAGIHVRPSGVIFNELGSYPGKIILSVKNQEYNLNSVISLLTMGLMKGDKVEVTVTGENEEAICNKAVELLERIYDFPPRQ